MFKKTKLITMASTVGKWSPHHLELFPNIFTKLQSENLLLSCNYITYFVRKSQLFEIPEKINQAKMKFL
jgi:hypothetical protein